MDSHVVNSKLLWLVVLVGNLWVLNAQHCHCVLLVLSIITPIVFIARMIYIKSYGENQEKEDEGEDEEVSRSSSVDLDKKEQQEEANWMSCNTKLQEEVSKFNLHINSLGSKIRDLNMRQKVHSHGLKKLFHDTKTIKSDVVNNINNQMDSLGCEVDELQKKQRENHQGIKKLINENDDIKSDVAYLEEKVKHVIRKQTNRKRGRPSRRTNQSTQVTGRCHSNENNHRLYKSHDAVVPPQGSFLYHEDDYLPSPDNNNNTDRNESSNSESVGTKRQHRTTRVLVCKLDGHSKPLLQKMKQKLRESRSIQSIDR